MAEKKKMSVAEILAAARKANSETAPAEQPGAPSFPSESQSPVPETVGEPAEAPGQTNEPGTPENPAPKPAVKPAGKPAGGGAAKSAGGGRPSVAEMLAMARAQKAGGAPADSPDKPAAAKPAAKAPKPAAAEKPAKPAKAEPVVVAEKDTASILAAARSGAKPGPITKAEAAAAPAAASAAKPAPRGRPVPPMPVKPDYAKPKPKVAPNEEDRRGFLQTIFGSFMAIGFFALAATTGLMTLLTTRFMFPNVLTEPPSRFPVGFPGNFAPGQVETKYVAQYGAWIVNAEYQGQSQIYALKTVCTHLGCTPNWLEGEQKFKCPCHGSGFYKDGINFEGPAPRPLERYAIRLRDDGQIEVDKGKTFQEEIGQWSDPSSFVPV